MEKPKNEESGLDQDDLNLDIKDHQESNNSKEQGLMEEHLTQPEDSSRKAVLLAKLSLLIAVIGIGSLGYLQFHNGASTKTTIANSKVALRKEITAEIKNSISSSQQPQIQALMDKNAELEVKVNGYEAKINDLEMKLSEFQLELEKNANLGTKVAELQSLMKKGKPPVKAKSANSTKPKTSGKLIKKKRK